MLIFHKENNINVEINVENINVMKVCTPYKRNKKIHTA